MADKDVSLEDNQESKGFLGVLKDKAVNTVSSIGNVIQDIDLPDIADTGKSILKTGGDFIKGAWDVFEEVTDPINPFHDNKDKKRDGVFSFKDLTTDIPQGIQISEDDRKLGKELNNVGGWQMAKELGPQIFDLGINSLFGNQIERNLKQGININDFNSQLSTINRDLEEYNKKKEEIASNEKYANLNNFSKNVYDQYMKRYGTFNEQEFNNFQIEKFNELNSIEQANILKQEQLLNNDLKSLDQNINSKNEELKSLLNDSLVADDKNKTGYDLYEDFVTKQEEKNKNNKYMNLIGEIRQDAENQVNEDIIGIGLEKISDYGGLNDFKAAIIDDLAVDKQYTASILGMDIEDKDGIYKKLTDINKVSYKLNLDILKNYASIRNLPENKGLSEVDLKNKAFQISYKGLTEEEKNKFRSKESIINSIAQIKEQKDIVKKLKNFNPLFVLDVAAYGGAIVKKYVDNVFDYEQEIPHYIQQETRNLIYSNEGNWDKFKSIFSYNMDVPVSIFLSGGLLKGGVKGLTAGGSGLLKASKLLKDGKVMNIPLSKIGFDSGIAKYVGSTTKALTAAQFYGAGIDPIFDSHMIEAPTDTIEAFNQISNIFFDATPLVVGDIYKFGAKTGTRSMNSLVYKFMIDEDKKAAVKEIQQVLKDKHKIDINESELYTVLDQGVKPLYGSVYNPDNIKNLFEKESELYKYIGNNISNMETNNLKEILTGNGLGLKRYTNQDLITGFTKEQRNDLNTMIDVVRTPIDSQSKDAVQQQIKQAIAIENINKQLGKLDSLFKAPSVKDRITGGADGFQFKSSVFKDPNFIKESEDIIDQVDQIRRNITSKNIPDNINQKLDSIYAKVGQMQRQYESNKKIEEVIELYDFETKTPIRIAYNKLEDLIGKNFFDLVKEGRITVEKEGIYKGKQLGFRTMGLSDMTQKFDAYLKRTLVIDDYINKNLDFFTNTDKSSTRREIAQQIRNLVLPGRKPGEGIGLTVAPFFQGIDEKIIQSKIHGYADMINEVLSGFFGKEDGVDLLSKKPHNINQLLDKSENGYADTKVVKAKAIIEKVSTIDSYINLSYGYFHSTKKIGDNYVRDTDKGWTNAFYLTFGKKTQEHGTSMHKALNDEGIKQRGAMGQYMASLQEFRDRLFNYSFKEGKFNIKEGLAKTEAVYGAVYGAELFKDKVLNKELLSTYVGNLLKPLSTLSKDNAKQIEEVKNFVYEIFKESREGDELVMKPMITNLLYHYTNNKELIDNIIKNDKLKNPKFEEIFSELLLSGYVAKDISTKISKSTKEEYKKHYQISEGLEAKLKSDWDRYQNLMKGKILLLKSQKNDIERLLKKYPDIAKDTTRVDNELQIIDQKIKSIENLSKQPYSENIKSHFINFNTAFLKEKANSFVNMLAYFNKEERKEINNVRLNDISYSMQLDRYRDIFSDIENGRYAEEDVNVIKKFEEDIRSNEYTRQDITRKVKDLKYKDGEKDVPDNIKQDLYTIQSVHFSDFGPYKIKRQESEFFKYSDNVNLLYDYDMFFKNGKLDKNNNLYIKWFNGFLNNNDAITDESINSKIFEVFGQQYIPAQIINPNKERIDLLEKQIKELEDKIDHPKFKAGLDSYVEQGRLDESIAKIIYELYKNVDDKILSKINFSNKNPDNIKALGAFKYDTKELLIRPGQLKGNSLRIFLHEYGHFADNNILNKKDKDIIKNFYDKNSSSIKEAYEKQGLPETFEYVDSFVKKGDYREFIAEEFSHYVINKKIRFKELEGIIGKIYKEFIKQLQKLAESFGFTQKIKGYSDIEKVFEKMYNSPDIIDNSKEIIKLKNELNTLRSEPITETKQLTGDDLLKEVYKISRNYYDKPNKSLRDISKGIESDPEYLTKKIEAYKKSIGSTKLHTKGLKSTEKGLAFLEELKTHLDNLKPTPQTLESVSVVPQVVTQQKLKNVYDLYEQSKEFRDFVGASTPYYEGDKVIFKIPDGKGGLINADYFARDKYYKKILKQIFEGNEILTEKANKNKDKVDLSDQLLDQLLKDKNLIDRIKLFANRTEYIRPIDNQKAFLNFKERKVGDYQILEYNETPKYNEKILKIDKMLNDGMDVIFTDKINFGKLGYQDGDFAVTIKGANSFIVNEINLNLLNKNLTSEQKLQLYLDKEIFRSQQNDLKTFYDMWRGDISGIRKAIGTKTDKSTYEYGGFDFKEFLQNNEKFNQLHKDGYSFVGNFGDKDSVFHFYKQNILDSIEESDRHNINELLYAYEYAYSSGYILKENDTFEKFIKELKAELGKGKITYEKLYNTIQEKFSDRILDFQKIKKRESAEMSNYTTFGEIDLPVTTYVIDELFDKKIIDNFMEYTGIEKVEDLIKGIKDESIKPAYIYASIPQFNEPGLTKEELIDYIENTYLKDLQDGTSFASKKLGALRGAAQGLGSESKMNDYLDKGDFRQFKDHMSGFVNNTKMLAKTLFNVVETIEYEGKDLSKENVAVIGSGSLKLKGGFNKFTEQKIITIDGKKYKVIGQVKDTTTQFFKNAGSDLLETRTDTTIGSSILAGLSDEASQQIFDLIKVDIDKLWENFCETLVDRNISFNSFSELDKAINREVQTSGRGIGSPSILNNKLTKFLNEVNELMKKPKDEGQSVFIRESNTNLELNEVLMSDKSELVKQLRDEVSMKKYQMKYSELKDTEIKGVKLKDNVDSNLFSIGYRYPVPSKYSVGAFRVKIVEKEKNELGELKYPEYKYMGKDQVVCHPFATYMKFTGDNDGDHLFFISATSKFGEIIAKDIIPGIDKKSNILDRFTNNKNFKNDFVVAKEITKAETSTSKMSLPQRRLAALDGKSTVGTVAGTGRTVKFIQQAIERGDDKMFLNRTLNKELITKDRIKLWKDVLPQKLSNLEKIFTATNFSGPEGAKRKKEFYKNYNSILNAVVDFGNTDLEKFDQHWFVPFIGELMGKKKLNTFDKANGDIKSMYSIDDLNEIFDIADTLITPLSKMYKKTNLSPLNINKTVLSKEKKKEVYKNQRNKVTGLLGGIKRDIFDYIVDTYGEKLKLLNRNDDMNIIVEGIEIAKGQGKVGGFDRSKPFYKIINDPESVLKKMYPNLNIKIDKQQNGWSFFSKEDAKILNERIFNKLKFDGKNKLLPGSKEFIDKLKKYIQTDNKKTKGELRKELYTEDNITLLDKDRNAFEFAVSYSHVNGEFKLIQFLTNGKKLQHLDEGDSLFKQKLIDGGFSLPDIKVFNSIEEYEKALKLFQEEKLKELQELDNIYEQSKLNLDTDKMDNISYSIQRDNIEYELNEIDYKIDNIRDDYKEKDITYATAEIPEIIDYNFPIIKTDIIDIDSNAKYQILYTQANDIRVTDGIVKLRTSNMFEKYIPDYMEVYSIIRDFMNIDKSVSEIGDNHIAQMVPYTLFSGKKGIASVAKRSGLNNIEGFLRSFQNELIDYQEGFLLKDTDNIIKQLSKKVTGTFGEKLFKPKDVGGNLEEFIDSIEQYKKDVALPIVQKLNELETLYGYEIGEAYKKDKASLITDVIESHKSDGKFALKIKGIKSKDEFIKLLEDRGLTQDKWINKGHARVMANILYRETPDILDSITSLAKGFHQQFTYGLVSTLTTQNGFLAGLSQMYPNRVEVKSIATRYGSLMDDSIELMDKYAILNAENTLMFGTGFMKEMNGETLTDKLISKTLKSLGMNHPKSHFFTSLLHSIATNPLGASDYFIESFRKQAAVAETMKKFGIKNSTEFERMVNLHGDGFIGKFKHHVNTYYVQSGGGVISSSQIYRDTIFTHLHDYVENVPGLYHVAKFFSQTIGYLMGWAYHKSAVLIEKESAFAQGIFALVFSKDKKSAIRHIQDGLAYNEYVARYAAYGFGLHLKFQKFEKDNNDRVSWWEFQKMFNNQVIVYEMLTSRRVGAWNTAGEMKGTTGDKIKYTTYSELSNILRLFKQPKFIQDVFDHYKASSVKGDQDIWDSLQFAMDQNYSGYLKFQGLNTINDEYNSLLNKGNTGLLLLGGGTDEEELFNQLIEQNIFQSFKDKGVFNSLLSKIFHTGGTPAYDLITDLSKEVRELVTQDPEIRKLISGGQIGKGENDFNLDMIIGGELDEDKIKAITDLYYTMTNSTFVKFDSLGKKISEKNLSGHQLRLKTTMLEALQKEGINSMEEFAHLKDSNLPYYLEMLSKLEINHNVSSPVAVGLYIDELVKQGNSAEYKRLGRPLTETEYLKVKQDILLKNQELINLNSEAVFDTIEGYAINKFGDTLDKYQGLFENSGLGVQSGLDYINRSYLLGKIINTDTSVSKLHSRYALALKGIKDTDGGVNMVIDFLYGLNELPYISEKEKLANGAAAILGLNKALNGRLSDKKEYLKISEGSRKLLGNWMYKIGSESIDFDSNELINSVNRSEGGYVKSGVKYYPTKQSKSTGGARPNFSKQFDPIRSMMPNIIQDINRDPNGFLRKNNPYTKNNYINPAKFPILKKLTELNIENIFYGFRSKGIIQQNIKSKQGTKDFVKEIKLKKPKPVKTEKVTKKFKKPVKTLIGLNPNLPLGTVRE